MKLIIIIITVVLCKYGSIIHQMVNGQNENGDTPLHLNFIEWIKSGTKNEKLNEVRLNMTSVLLESGAGVCDENKNKKTQVDLAIELKYPKLLGLMKNSRWRDVPGEPEKVLIEVCKNTKRLIEVYGPSICDQLGCDDLVAEDAERCYSKDDPKCIRGWRSTMPEFSGKNIDEQRLFRIHGYTPLHINIFDWILQGTSDEVENERRLETTRTLLNGGYRSDDICIKNKDGQTPIDLAIILNYPKLLDLINSMRYVWVGTKKYVLKDYCDNMKLVYAINK